MTWSLFWRIGINETGHTRDLLLIPTNQWHLQLISYGDIDRVATAQTVRRSYLGRKVAQFSANSYQL